MKNKIDRIAARISRRGLTADSSLIEKRVARAIQIVTDSKDEEIWRTSENGKHYQLETETGEITKGFGGTKNGTKIQPKASRAGSTGGASITQPSTVSPRPKTNETVQNPEKGQKLTSASRRKVQKEMLSGLDGVGEGIDSFGNTTSYRFPKGFSRESVALTASNSARKAGFKTQFWKKNGAPSDEPTSTFSIVDPNDIYKSIDVTVSKSSSSGSDGVYYDVDISDAY